MARYQRHRQLLRGRKGVTWMGYCADRLSLVLSCSLAAILFAASAQQTSRKQPKRQPGGSREPKQMGPTKGKPLEMAELEEAIRLCSIKSCGVTSSIMHPVFTPRTVANGQQVRKGAYHPPRSYKYDCPEEEKAHKGI
eukprot:6469131-Amphidinium_carterae.1